MVTMVSDGANAENNTRRPSFSSAGRSNSNSGPCLRFEGIRLELSSFAGCQFDFTKDGSLLLSFQNFSGSMTLRSNSHAQASSEAPHSLCSTNSEAGSLGVLDVESAMDIDIALSQLEQDSPKSVSGLTFSPGAMRQTCEGNPHQPAHRSESGAVPIRRPSNTTASGTSGFPSDSSCNRVVSEQHNLSLSALVSPPSSMRKEQRQNPVAGSPLRRSSSTTVEADPVVASNPLSPAQTNSPHDGDGASPSTSAAPAAAAARGGRSGSRPVSPDNSIDTDDGVSPAKSGVSGSAARPKGKRARRTRGGETSGAKSPSTPTALGGRGSGSGRKRRARRTAALVLAPEKENSDIFASLDKGHVAGVAAGAGSAAATAAEKGLKKKRKRRGSLLEQCVVDAMEKQEDDGEVEVGEYTQEDDKDSSTVKDGGDGDAQRKEVWGTQQGPPAVDVEGDSCGGGGHAVEEPSSLVGSAATPAHGLLRRFAKAVVLDTRNEQVGGSGSSSGPMGRWGHSATMITESQMLVLGGQADDDAHQATLGDLYKFDFETHTWSRPMNCDSIPRAWHTASFLPDKNLLVIFGGERTVDGCPECLDDIMVLDTVIDLLYPPAISGKAPSSRSGHSAAIIGNELIVFGGVRGRKWQNNVAVLDTERWHWRHPTIDGSNPAPRSYHSATVVGKLMVVFGGNNQDESFDKVHVLDTSMPRWSWTCPEVVGAAPAARTGHTALLLPDGYTIAVHGGWDPEGSDGVQNYGDCYLLDTKLWEWSRGPDSLLGDGATALRVGHTSVLTRRVGDEGEQGKEEREARWQSAFFGGQDGEGVRGAELAISSL